MKGKWSHETKPEKIYETKRNFTSYETKRNFACFLFRETSEISRNNLFVSLCFVFRETKKRMRNGNPRCLPFLKLFYFTFGGINDIGKSYSPASLIRPAYSTVHSIQLIIRHSWLDYLIIKTEAYISCHYLFSQVQFSPYFNSVKKLFDEI
jgi:hypothetical protein